VIIANAEAGTKRNVVLATTILRSIISGTIFPITVQVVESGKKGRVPIAIALVKFDIKNFGITSLSIARVRGGTRSSVRIRTVMAVSMYIPLGVVFRSIVGVRGGTQ